jgi:uncharacterized protein YwbE
MAMTSMKITRKEITEANPVDTMMPVTDVPNYPYGLKIRLCDEDLGRLSFNVGDHRVGETGTLTAKYVIEKLEADPTEGGGEQEVCIQITDLDLGVEKKTDRWVLESKSR